MPAAPRVVYAVRNESASTRVHVRAKELPIIVVPGIMGSRLTDPRTDKLVWNPLGEPLGEGPGVFTVDPDRLQDIAAPLVPDETHRYDLHSKHKKIAHIRHFYNVIPKFYAPLAQHLASMKLPALEGLHLVPRVYCCGYDWRQDNSRSAARLASVVDEALRETGARKVIIVAHSMGGLVARYYCRALGGEARVHQLILLASPTMGAPAAYAQLRQGLYGSYIKDLVRHAEAKAKGMDDLTEEVIETSVTVMSSLAAMSVKGPGAVVNIFGDILLAMSVGAGRFLTREESRYFARQIPALYQLLPNGVFCHQNPMWVIFDPLVTGHRPTGFMLQLPATLDLTSAVAGNPTGPMQSNAQRMASQFADVLKNAAADGESAEISGRALRNSMNLDEWGTALGKLMAAGEMGDAVKLALELVEHADRAFVDGRSSRALYSDIYTGLLDMVSLRSVSATNLAMAFAFDSALTVDDRPREPVTPLTPIKMLFSLIGRKLGDAVAGPKKALDKQEMRNLIQLEIDQHPPKVYMHPRTTNIYGTGVPGDGGAILIPRKMVSRDDSNLVKVLYLMRPHPIGAPHSLGDGTVPEASANPDPKVLSNPFIGKPVPVPKKAHNEVPVDEITFKALEAAIAEQIEHFPRD